MLVHVWLRIACLFHLPGCAALLAVCGRLGGAVLAVCSGGSGWVLWVWFVVGLPCVLVACCSALTVRFALRLVRLFLRPLRLAMSLASTGAACACLVTSACQCKSVHDFAQHLLCHLLVRACQPAYLPSLPGLDISCCASDAGGSLLAFVMHLCDRPSWLDMTGAARDGRQPCYLSVQALSVLMGLLLFGAAWWGGCLAHWLYPCLSCLSSPFHLHDLRTASGLTDRYRYHHHHHHHHHQLAISSTVLLTVFRPTVT